MPEGIGYGRKARRVTPHATPSNFNPQAVGSGSIPSSSGPSLASLGGGFFGATGGGGSSAAAAAAAAAAAGSGGGGVPGGLGSLFGGGASSGGSGFLGGIGGSIFGAGLGNPGASLTPITPTPISSSTPAPVASGGAPTGVRRRSAPIGRRQIRNLPNRIPNNQLT